MRDMSTDARNGGDTSSCDVLFPETFEVDTLQTPYCSLYPNDSIVDPRYLRGSSDVLNFWPEMEEADGNETLYAVPLTGNCPAKLRRACISTFVGPRWTAPYADRRKTWSPPTFERVMNCTGDLLAVRSCYSNDQLAADSTNCDVQCGGNSDVPSGGNSDVPSGGNIDFPGGGNSDVPSGGNSDVASSGNGSNITKAPPKLAPVSGILNNNTRVIRPIAFRPMVTHQMTQRHVDEHMTQCQSVPSHNNVASQYYQLPSCHRSPCPSQASPNLSTASCRMSQTSSQVSPNLQHRFPQHLPKRSPVSPRSSTQQSVYDPASSPGQLTVTRSANRTQDEGYMSQEYQSHADHTRKPNHSHNPNYSHDPNHSHDSNHSHNPNHSRDSNHIHNPNYSHDSNHSHNPNHSHDSNYSHANHSDRQNQSSYSHANICHGPLQRDGYTGGYHGNGRSDSLSSSNLSGASSSPSDSGVLELESMVREKDAVIEQLRETMVRNETAIIETYRQKQQNWEMHLRQVHAEWQRRLRAEQRRSYDTEQALLHQVSRLRQALPRDDRSRRVSPTKSDTGSDAWMDRVKEELRVVTGLYEKTRHELEATQRQLELVRQESGSSVSGGQTVKRSGQSSGGPIAKCEPPVASHVTELEKLLATEREQWMEEKNKVVRYQRHLQLNYVQMYRKNKMLEADVEQLTLELENRHIVDATAMAASVDGAKLMVTNLAVPVDESSC